MKYLIILAMVLLSSCSGLHQLKNLAQTKTDIRDESSRQEQATRQWRMQQQDSSATDLEVEIWPRGIITYTDSGFSGDVQRIKLRKKVKQQTHTQQQAKEHVAVAENKVLSQKQHAVVKTLVKNRVGISGWIWLLLIIPVYLVWRYLKNRL